MKQAYLFSQCPKFFHGGELARGRRKVLRPLSRKRPIHLTLKASRLLSPDRPWISAEVRRLAKRFGIRIYSLVVAPDHIHGVLQIPGRSEFISFIRALTGRLARKLGRGLWNLLPFTRVAHWGRDFRGLLAYLQKNREEMEVRRAYEPHQPDSRRTHVLSGVRLSCATLSPEPVLRLQSTAGFDPE